MFLAFDGNFFQNREFADYLTFDLIHLLWFFHPQPSSIIDEFATYICIKRMKYLRPNKLFNSHHCFYLYLFSFSWLSMYLAILRSRKNLNPKVVGMSRSNYSVVKCFWFFWFNLTLCIMIIMSVAMQEVHSNRGSDI